MEYGNHQIHEHKLLCEKDSSVNPKNDQVTHLLPNLFWTNWNTGSVTNGWTIKYQALTLLNLGYLGLLKPGGGAPFRFSRKTLPVDHEWFWCNSCHPIYQRLQKNLGWRHFLLTPALFYVNNRHFWLKMAIFCSSCNFSTKNAVIMVDHSLKR